MNVTHELIPVKGHVIHFNIFATTSQEMHTVDIIVHAFADDADEE